MQAGAMAAKDPAALRQVASRFITQTHSVLVAKVVITTPRVLLCLPLSSVLGTYQTVRTRIWPGRTGKTTKTLSVVTFSLGSVWGDVDTVCEGCASWAMPLGRVRPFHQKSTCLTHRLWGRIWCKVGHIPRGILRGQTRANHRVGRGEGVSHLLATRTLTHGCHGCARTIMSWRQATRCR